MKGSLQELAVVDLIQHHCLDRNNVCVQLRNGRDRADLFFKNGNLVHATMADEEGEEVVYQVMHWEEGTFEDRADLEAPTISITRGWTGLLLEGARRYDEAASEDENAAEPLEEQTPEARGRGLFSSLLARLGEARGAEGQYSVQIAPEVSRVWAEEGGIVASSRIGEEVQVLMLDLGSQIEGFYGAAVADLKGNILLNALGRGADVEATISTASQFVKTVGDAAGKLGMGGLEDNLLTTENAYILTNFITSGGNFLLITAEKKSANLGSMRRACKICVNGLIELGLDRITIEG